MEAAFLHIDSILFIIIKSTLASSSLSYIFRVFYVFSHPEIFFVDFNLKAEGFFFFFVFLTSGLVD